LSDGTSEDGTPEGGAPENGAPVAGPPGDGTSEEEARARHVALIDACFEFPCAFSLSVIANNEEAVTAAVLAAATVDGEAPIAHEPHPSKGGKYVSHRLDVRCANAHEAHELRVRLRAVPGVINVL
jgi:putative lipoic acid-binding regulatory protein